MYFVLTVNWLSLEPLTLYLVQRHKTMKKYDLLVHSIHFTSFSAFLPISLAFHCVLPFIKNFLPLCFHFFEGVSRDGKNSMSISKCSACCEYDGYQNFQLDQWEISAHTFIQLQDFFSSYSAAILLILWKMLNY